MHPAAPLLARLDGVEALREDLLGAVRPLGADTLRTRPEPTSWSLLEIIEHLVRAEEAVLGPEGAGVEGAAAAGRGSRLLYGVVWAVLRLGIPVQVPAAEMQPRGEAGLAELTEEWRDRHRGLRGYLEGLDSEGLRRPVFAHPVIGSLRPKEALVLGETHLRRHQGQLRRTYAAVLRDTAT